MILLSACSSKQTVNQNLSSVSGLKTLSDMTQIALEWTASQDSRVAGYYLYRSNPHNLDAGMQRVAKIPDRFSTHYVDTKLEPSTTYHYELRSYDQNNNISPRGQIVSAYTTNLLSSVSYAQVLSNLPGRAKILWRPHSDTRVASYVIERNEKGRDSWRKIAEVNGRLSVEYIDSDVEPNQEYEYRIFVKTSDGTVSTPSQAFSATTKALPNSINGLQATKNLPKKIVLTWEENTNEDFAYYRIYSASNSILPMTKLADTRNTTYEDLVNKNGVTKYYKVVAVDRDGQESKQQSQAVQGATLDAPKAPVLTNAVFNGMAVDLSWNSQTSCSKFKIIKSSQMGEESIETQDFSYSDSSISMGLTYDYRVICIDEYGIQSEKSNKLEVETK